MMRFLALVFLLKNSNSAPIIKNVNIPSCRDCIHFKPDDITSNYASYFSKCSKFGDKNIITNVISYEDAKDCRRDELKCGKEGKYFEQQEWVELKIFIHELKYYSPLIIFTSILTLYLIVELKK